MNNKKILLIEDDATQVMMYSVEFENFGYKLLVANKGKDGIDLANKEKPDLILLDMLLGDMEGIEVLKTIKNDPKTKDLKVVVMSNFSKKGIEQDCRQAGAFDFWSKSQFVPREIVTKAEAAMKAS